MWDIFAQNRQIRRLLAQADLESPGIKLHLERVSVYSVAVAERLGWADDRLIAVRLAAELRHLHGVPAELSGRMAPDNEAKQLIDLCEQFVRGQSVGGQGLSWLQYEAFHHFDRRYVKALAEVQLLITPSD